MKLAEMLGYADIAQLGRIAEAYNCECNSHSKNELIQSILLAMNRKEVMQNQVGALAIEELRFVNSLLFDNRNVFSLEDLIARVQQGRFEVPQGEAKAALPTNRLQKNKKKSKANKNSDQPPSPRETIAKLKYAGWLFNGFSSTNRYLFHVPTDMKDRFRDELAVRFEAGLTQIAEPEGFRDEQELLADDMLKFLSYLRQHEVPLNAEGAMYRRTIAQLVELFHVSEALPSKGEWRFGYGRRVKDYPNRMSFIYDFCYYHGYIAESASVLELTPLGKEQVEQRRLPSAAALLKFWLRLYKGPIPSLVSLVHWINLLARQWVTADSLANTLLPFVKPYYYDSAAIIMQQRIFGMMMHLGLLRIGEHHQAGQVVRMTKIGLAAVSGVHIAEEDKISMD
ncbi:hypothetical protein EBB07_20025 [Paenibacillaceae bacterium]|nr:hypothetical protein EBB07_20025 [Paenibacillaceae bacterium]